MSIGSTPKSLTFSILWSTWQALGSSLLSAISPPSAIGFPSTKKSHGWGPKKKGVAIASIVNAAANYWKHVEDGEGAIRAATRKVLEQIGVTLDSSYCVSNALYECGYQNLAGLLEDLVKWRNAVLEQVNKNG